MGSYSTLLKQSLALVALIAIVAWAAPTEAKIWCVATGLIMLAFFVVVSLWRHRQIKTLSAEVDEVLHDGRRLDFSRCREGDIAILSNELEKMVARLARTTELLEHERNALANSLADISHQIRTPLTAAELMLPAIERMDDPDERKIAIRNLEEMLERIAWLVTTLLKIAKVDAGAIKAQALPVRAADAISRACSPLETSFDLRDISLTTEVMEDAVFTGDELWTAEAIQNILKNCMEHTPAGGTVSVKAVENALATTITITDTGPGISEEDLPHIFERFYRGSMISSDPAPEGFGIGLALAQALISVQGGTLRACNDPEAGARFQIAFPKLVV